MVICCDALSSKIDGEEQVKMQVHLSQEGGGGLVLAAVSRWHIIKDDWYLFFCVLEKKKGRKKEKEKIQLAYGINPNR